jgi:CRISPR-associated endonuclease/helicase Cas3
LVFLLAGNRAQSNLLSSCFDPSIARRSTTIATKLEFAPGQLYTLQFVEKGVPSLSPYWLLMDLSLLFWAKLGSATWPETYHPVTCHLIDVGQVARRLWSDVCGSKVRQWVTARLGLSEDAAGAWLAFWAGAHDIGKVSPGFQAKSPQAKEALRKEGFRFIGNDDTPHGTVSAAVLPRLVHQTTGWPAIPEPLAYQVAVAIGGHHGIFPSASECRLGTTALGDTNAKWDDARRTILGQLARSLGVDVLPPPTGPQEHDHAAFMFLAGLTSVADWIGSASEFFPFAGGAVDLNDYPRQADERARIALDRLGWTGWSGTAPLLPFEALFPQCAPPRPLQAEAVRQAAGFTGPGLVLVEAPMGEGKTEAALFLADHWNHALGQRGCYVALPTQATSNQMFRRVRDFLAHRYPSERVNLHLLHGGSDLSKDYRELRLAAVHDQDGKVGEERVVVAESWFTPKKRGLLAPFAVGTIDQALLSVLQTRHGFVRLFGLAGKTVILDEVHAYDAYTSTLLDRLLAWLAALGSSVVLLSATLPSARRRQLLEAYAGAPVKIPDCSYPRLITATADNTGVTHIPVSEERRSNITIRWEDPGQLAKRLTEALAQGGCAAVVCNTVADAQRTYLDLRETLPHGVQVRLFHARFPALWRQEIENQVLDCFGGATDNPRRPRASVLVATQVIEQSLDLDFDLMVSAVAPVDLVLQRAGRLHRHKRRLRPVGLAGPQLWLLRPDFDEKDIAVFGTSEFVYDRYVLLRSYLALCDRDQTPIRLPDEMEALIEEVYSDESSAGLDDAWTAALETSRRELERWRDQAERKALHCVIKLPSYSGDLLRDFNRELDEDAPDQHPTLQALTRLAERNVSVILLRQTANGLTDLDGRGVDLHRRPNLDDTRRLLGCAVTLTRAALVNYFSAAPVPSGWGKCASLRHHRPAILDAGGILRAGGCVLRLDRELGVVIEVGEKGPNGGA